MTLIIGIGCEDGAIIASESASTDTESGTKQPYIKVRRLKDENILYGGSGDVGLIQKIQESLKNYRHRNNIKNIRQELKIHIIPVLKESNQLHAPYPQSQFYQPPIAIFLFVGIINEHAWILEIERDGRDTLYGEDMGYFHAIGSGKPWAQASFRRYLHEKRKLELGKVLAYRTIYDSIALSAMGLSEPVQIHILKSDCDPEEILEDEIERLKDTCETWKTLETETLGKLLAPSQKETGTTKIPKT